MDTLCESENIWNDQAKAKKFFKERSNLASKVNLVKDVAGQLQQAVELVLLCQEEQDFATISEIEKELNVLARTTQQKEIECMFANEADGNSCFLEIHSGAGGTESDDWASILLRMYTRWAEKHGYKTTVVDYLAGEEAGVKSVTLKVVGTDAYGWLKTEAGIHRLVRISPFNSAGKRHTSFASVGIYPIVDDSISIEIKEVDLKIDTYRASGAGGQHVNTTDSAVRITHIPSGIVVQSQNDRSQHRNKAECISMLKSKLYELELKKKEEKAMQENAAKTEIGWGHQIRSYVLHPYQLVKDLRTNYQEYNTSAVLDGEIDGFICATLRMRLKGQGL
ncbi:Peptide chain release factor 2 [Alphaproteobacteria bacterium]